MTQQSQIDRALVERTLGYHGKPFQKIWETGRRENDLQRIGIGKDPDLSVYIARQKHLTLKDRAKRLKLHQFMVKNADILYSASLSVRSPEKLLKEYKECKQFTIPSMDVFMAQDSNNKAEQLLKHVQPGDVLYGTVMPHKSALGTMLKPLLIIGNVTYYVRNLPIKATIAPQMMAPTLKIENGAPKSSYTAETICCEVVDVAADALRLFCSTWRSIKSRVPESIAYGLVKEDDIPLPYKITLTRRNEGYEDFLEQSASFCDPSFTERLYKEVGLDSSEFYTNMSSMKGRYPSQEYASELRNSQNSKWAFRSVAQGIEHFKEGRHSEAFQCLNKALSMDPRNVEGLVARGALYANSGSFKKAVDDFEAALKLNPAHANARKYMGETLVALGRSYEEENRIEEAKKAYQDCLNIIPHHEEAQTSLDFLMKTKPYGKQIVEPTELEIPTLNIGKPSSSDRHKQEPDTSGGSGGFGGGSSSSKRDASEPSRKDRKKESKKERKKRHKKHHSSSSESSSESTDSSDSSSDSSSSSSSSTDSSTSDSSGSRNKKRKRSKSEKKVKSLSPLSKRMSAAMAGRGGVGGPGELVGYPIGQGSVFGQGGGGGGVGAAHVPTDDYEQQVRKFLEMPRDEEDYEEKVRRFVAEANKYQKERKQLEDKSKKKKKKDEKKSKKDSKKKRKSDEKKKSKKKDKSGGGGGGDDDGLDKDKLREALKIFENFPVLDELGTKLSEYYAKIEKQQSSSGSVAEALSAILGSGSGSGGAGSSRAKPSELPNLERGIGPGGAADDNTKDGKWRMMFNKDKRPSAAAGAKEPIATGAPTAAASSGSLSAAAMGSSKQHAFSNESDDESPSGGGPSSYGAPKIQPYVDVRSNRFGFSSGRYDEHRGGRGGSVEKMKPSAANLVKSGPVVLDKFGNFRLATAETPGGSGGGAGGGSKPPEPSVAPPGSRRSRSKSRHRTYGSSRSRSRSRSERRRSRSGSFRRRFSRSRSRSFSRSRSGSYSRSRSRSRSFERRRFDRRIYRGGRGGGGGGYGGGGDRMGSFGGNRFNNPRGHYRRGGFRDFRDNRFMGNRGGGGGGGGGGRDRPPFRPRYRGRFQRSYSRSTSKSPDRRPLSPGDDRLSRRDYGRRGDSRDRGVMGQGGRGGGADSRERSPARRGSSRADSRDNQRADSRSRRSEDRDSSPRRRSKDDSVGGAAGGNSKTGGDGDAANDSSPAGSPSRDKTVTAKSKRDRRRSSSVASHNSSGGGSARIPPDVEGRWADDPREDGPSRRARDNGAAGEHAAASEAGEGGSHSSAAAIAAVADDATLEELEKMLTKARKERKEDMLERNKDLLKKGSSGGSGSGGY